MAINIDSEAWCRKAYLNYHCYGNSMNISADEMGEITKRWESKLTSWQATVSNDENEYEFDDSDYAASKLEGKRDAQDATGYEGGGKGKMWSRGIGDATSALANAVGQTAGKKVVEKAGEKVVIKVAEKVTGKTAENAAATATSNNTAAAGFIVGCTLGLATATAYMAKKPNKEQKEACDELQNVMKDSQASLQDSQSNMEHMANEIIELSDEANEANEDANNEIKEKKAQYDMYRASYEALKAKADSGEPLTEEEKALYQELVKYMTETGEGITTIQEDTTDTVGEAYEDMGTYQDGYDEVADTMGNIEGITDFAESFDEATQTLCYVETVAQGLNAAASTKAAFDAGKFAASGSWLFGATSWAWAFAAMGGAGAAMSVKGAREQKDWAKAVGTEIDLRKDTQSFNTETMDMYEEEIDAYDGHMQGVEDLELEIPDDVAPPEDTTLPPTTGDGLPTGTPEPIKPQSTNSGTTDNEDPNKKKNEK